MFRSIFRTQGNGTKLSGKFRLDIGRRLFPQRVAGHWNRLPRASPSLTEL